MNLFKRKNVIETIYSFIAVYFIGLGVALFVEASLGSDTLTVLLDGLRESFGISVSLSDQVITLVIFVLAFIVNRKSIGIPSIVNVCFIGLAIEISYQLFPLTVLRFQPFLFRLAIICLAQLMMCASYGWMQTFRSGMSATDALLIWIKDKLSISYAKVRLIYDAICVVSGVLLGGTIGIGTLIALGTSGVITAFFTKKLYHFALARRSYPS